MNLNPIQGLILSITGGSHLLNLGLVFPIGSSEVYLTASEDGGPSAEATKAMEVGADEPFELTIILAGQGVQSHEVWIWDELVLEIPSLLPNDAEMRALGWVRAGMRISRIEYSGCENFYAIT